MIRAILLILVCVGGASLPLAHAHASPLARAQDEFDRGDFQVAATMLREIVKDPELATDDRAEAFRILGLAEVELEQFAEARHSFLQYLLIMPDAHLDPALVAPETVALFEDVRAKHVVEIDAMRPMPETKTYWALNLVPSAGQFQNGDTTKGWLVASGMGVLLAANLTTYFVLRSYCNSDDNTCQSGNTDRTERARLLQNLNFLSGGAAIALYAYSMIDGFRGYRRNKRQEAMQIAPMSPSLDARGETYLPAGVAISGTF